MVKGMIDDEEALTLPGVRTARTRPESHCTETAARMR